MSKTVLDVLVVGAGPVGLFCANELTRHGLNCRIVDKKSALSDKSKALGLHIRTLDVMSDCGFIDQILAEGLQVEGALFKSKGKELANLTFKNVEANRHFIVDLPQDKTERILYEGLHVKGLDVEWQTELSGITQHPEGVCAALTGPAGNETITAPWLIACDGAHSTVRHLLEMEFVGSEYKHSWWLVDVVIEWALPNNRMVVYLHEEGPLACFPMQNKRYRLVMTAPEHREVEPNMEDIIAAFNRRSSDVAQLSAPVWITKFNLHHRQIQHYRKDNIFFAGDAAHIHSPMGGQGLNTGIQDAYNLVWKLALVQKKLAHENILDSYHMERYPVGLDVVKKTDVMTKMILITNPLLIALRNKLMSFMMSFNVLKNKLATDIAGLAISYADSPIVADQGSAKGFKAGYFLSDFNLNEASNNTVQPLHKIIQGTTHHLLLFAGLATNDVGSLIEIAALIRDKYPSMVIPHLILSQKFIKELDYPCTVWIDDHTNIHREYAIEQPGAVLLRPDKYIGLTQFPVDKDALMQYLNNIFAK